MGGNVVGFWTLGLRETGWLWLLFRQLTAAVFCKKVKEFANDNTIYDCAMRFRPVFGIRQNVLTNSTPQACGNYV